MTDDPGVMGNLPRSRPGRRSDKRAGGAAGGRKASGTGGASKPRATSAGKGRGGTARSSASSGAKAAGGKRSAGTARPRPPVKTPPRGPDPVGDAVRVATKLAGAGLGIAAGVLKRLPRP